MVEKVVTERPLTDVKQVDITRNHVTRLEIYSDCKHAVIIEAFVASGANRYR